MIEQISTFPPWLWRAAFVRGFLFLVGCVLAGVLRLGRVCVFYFAISYPFLKSRWASAKQTTQNLLLSPSITTCNLMHLSAHLTAASMLWNTSTLCRRLKSDFKFCMTFIFSCDWWYKDNPTFLISNTFNQLFLSRSNLFLFVMCNQHKNKNRLPHYCENRSINLTKKYLYSG